MGAINFPLRLHKDQPGTDFPSEVMEVHDKAQLVSALEGLANASTAEAETLAENILSGERLKREGYTLYVEAIV